MLELVGRYRIEARIGEGAMADVYRAYDPSIDRPLAVKVLKAEFRRHAEYAARFLREAKAAGALSHPGIVTVYDVGEIDGYPFIVMELLDGEPLSDVLGREGAMAPERVMAVGLQLADALAYAHAQGVVHRDIKPSNIVLAPDGRTIKLLDFGIARMAEAELFQRESLRTQLGQVLGTPRYMSPEQAMGRPLDGRSDLFSVGLVLYEMISGERAFAGASAATLALEITQQEPRPLSAAAPQSPRGLQFIVSKLLAKRPDRRFADGAQLAEALRKELAVHAAVAAEAQAKRTYLPLQVRLTLLLAALTATVLVASTGAVLWRQHRAMEQVAMVSGSTISSFVVQSAAIRAVDNAALPPDQQDWAPVQASVRHAAEDPNLRALTVADAAGVVRASTDPARVGRPYAAPPEPVEQRRADLTVTSLRVADGPGAFRFVRPITYAGRGFGTVDVTLSKAELEAAARLSRWLMLGLGLVTLGVVVGATYVATRLIERPLVRLKAAFRDAAKGDLDFRISHNRRDEFGELFDSFNLFTAAMQERLDSVESLALDTPSAAPVAAPPPPAPARPQGPFAPPSAAADPEPKLSFGSPRPPGPPHPAAAASSGRPGLSVSFSPPPRARPEARPEQASDPAPAGPPQAPAQVASSRGAPAADEDRTMIAPAPRVDR